MEAFGRRMIGALRVDSGSSTTVPRFVVAVIGVRGGAERVLLTHARSNQHLVKPAGGSLIDP